MRVLVVEDDAGIAGGLAAMLKGAGYAVDHCATLAHAWAAENAVDAIISTDGDSDRPLVADATGTWLRGDIVGLLCAHNVAADVVVTPVSSNTVLELSGVAPKVVRTRIEPLLKELQDAG